MGGYAGRASIGHSIRGDYKADGVPAGDHDPVLRFGNANMNNLVGVLGSTMSNPIIPRELLENMESVGNQMINLCLKRKIDIAQSSEFAAFDISTNGAPDPKKVGAVLLAAASVARVGGRGGHPHIMGTHFDNNLTFKEFETMESPGGFVPEHSPKAQDIDKIRNIAQNILQRGELSLKIQEAAQGATNSGVQPVFRCPSGVSNNVPNVSGNDACRAK